MQSPKEGGLWRTYPQALNITFLEIPFIIATAEYPSHIVCNTRSDGMCTKDVGKDSKECAPHRTLLRAAAQVRCSAHLRDGGCGCGFGTNSDGERL